MAICQQCPVQSHSLKEDTVNISCPPTLEKLARQSLLRAEALAISVLKHLPNKMFPVLFEEAFIGEHTKILTAMIPVWPFTYLSVGMKIKRLNLDTLKAVLEGLDILLAQKVHSSRCKLREINWQDTHHELCGIWAGFDEDEGFPEFMTRKQPVKDSPDCWVKKELKMTTQLHLKQSSFDECTTYLMQWAQQRKDTIHLCCRRLMIQDPTKATFVEIFKIVHADCIKELTLYSVSMEDLDFLNPYLRQMNNLLKLRLYYILDTFRMGASEALHEEQVVMFISQLPTFHCLQELYVRGASFIQGSLKECLRCLKKPLETLCISDCDLSQSDLDYLPYCLNIFELKCLKLIDISLCDLVLEPLGFLLERVRHTLTCLVLKSCEMVESQFNVLLPALSQCSHLTELNFCNNFLSLLFLKQLLHQTSKLSQLTHELYPAPLECYNEGKILPHRLEHFCPELLNILRAERQPIGITFATIQCLNCRGAYVYDLETQRCRFERALI